MFGNSQNSQSEPFDIERSFVTIKEAMSLVKAMAHKQSFLLLSSPGVGKTSAITALAEASGLPCRSLLGTQIAPEDVSGVPKIVNERTVFCPPRILLPEDGKPFCLFLDELPASSPDVQKSFYPLLLERRVGEHQLPPGSWVIAAGNRIKDKALVRTLSSALVNRVTILNIKVDVDEWLSWAYETGIHRDITAFIRFSNESLNRPPPDAPSPFSTPRSWASLSDALHLAEAHNLRSPQTNRALSFGLLSPGDAGLFSSMYDTGSLNLLTPIEYIRSPDKIPTDVTKSWCILMVIRRSVETKTLSCTPEELTHFFQAIPREWQLTLLTGLVKQWGDVGADTALSNILLSLESYL
jgi:hypothetical protein